MPAPPRPELPIARIARAAEVARRTVIRWTRGQEIRPVSRRRIERACAMLGVAIPPAPEGQDR